MMMTTHMVQAADDDYVPNSVRILSSTRSVLSVMSEGGGGGGGGRGNSEQTGRSKRSCTWNEPRLLVHLVANVDRQWSV